MASYQLTVEERSQSGKSYARKLRQDGKIPAVVYGSGNPATTIEVGVREVERALAFPGSLISLNIGSDAKTVIVKDIHRDPVRGDLRHVDFHEIDLTKKLEITVPIRVIGDDQRVSDGGVVTTLLWEVVVSCLPTDIPESIEVDVSELALDEVITVEELVLPEGVEVVAEPDEGVVKVDIPQLEVEEDDEDDEAAELTDEDGEAEESTDAEEASEE